MEEFSIKGPDGFVKISLAEVYTLPEGTCAVGGLEARAELAIHSGSVQLQADLFTSTGEIYAFYKHLKPVIEAGTGTAHFRTYEGKLELKLAFEDEGKVMVSGTFTGNGRTADKQEFGFRTDQASIRSTFSELKLLVDKYGDQRGRKRKTAD